MGHRKPLRVLIVRAGLTQKQVALHLGVGQGHLCDIVAGRAALASRHVIPLAELLGVSERDVLEAAGLGARPSHQPLVTEGSHGR